MANNEQCALVENKEVLSAAAADIGAAILISLPLAMRNLAHAGFYAVVSRMITPSKRTTALLLATFSLLGSLASKASIESTLTVKMLCYYQSKLVSNGGFVSASGATVRLDSKQLINILAKKLDIRYPNGSQIRVTPDGAVFIADPRGKSLGDVSDYLKFQFDGNAQIFTGKQNTLTGAETSRNYFPVTFILNLPGLTGSVSGVAIENLSVSNPNRDRVQLSATTTTSNVNGKGLVEDKLGYYEGSLVLSGRSAVVQPQ